MSGLKLVTPALTDFIYICHKLREDERAQFEAFGDGAPYDPEHAAIGLASGWGPRWTLVEADGGTPVVVGGFTMLREGVFQDWMIGTPEGWAQHWRSISKVSRRVMDKMLETEAHRLQCISLASRTKAHDWYRILGYKREGLLRGYGAHGEDAIMFARTSERQITAKLNSIVLKSAEHVGEAA